MNEKKAERRSLTGGNTREMKRKTRNNRKINKIINET